MSMDKEDKLDKELKEELEWLKYHAGSWEKLAYILYSFLPDQMQAFDRVIAVKSLQSEPRGTKLKYPTDDRMKWNMQVVEYRKKNKCSYPAACKQLLQSKKIKLPGSKHLTLDKKAKRLNKLLENERRKIKKFVSGRKGKRDTSIMDAILQNPPKKP